MNKYNNAKIYRLVCNITGLNYYGSTVQPLHKRKMDHKYAYDDYLKTGKIKYTSKKIIEGCNYDIILVEEFNCDNKNQLEARERHYIDNNECVNKVIPTRTIKEYREANKEKKKETDKQYREANKEIIFEKKKQYREANKEAIVKHKKETYEANKEAILKQKKETYEANKEAILKRNKEYRKANKEAIAKRNKEYREANKEAILNREKEYRSKKKNINSLI